MKTFKLFFALFLFSQMATAQMSTLPFIKNNSTAKNNIGLVYSTEFGTSLRFDRILYKKGNYALVGQAGVGLQYYPKDFFSKLHLSVALYNRFAFGDHNIEFGAGLIRSSKRWDPDAIRPLVYEPRERRTYLHLAYSLRPQDKNWYLKFSFDPTLKTNYDLKPNFSIGGGFSF